MCERPRRVHQASVQRVSIPPILNPGGRRKQVIVKIFAGSVWERRLLDSANERTAELPRRYVRSADPEREGVDGLL